MVNDDGKLVAKRRIDESVDGFAELTTLFAEAGDSPPVTATAIGLIGWDHLIPVAIETPRGLLAAALCATGRPISNGTRWPAPSPTMPTP